ncbi:MAG: CpaD family pilus assembly lipoprotein [Parvibaculales bacterium]
MKSVSILPIALICLLALSGCVSYKGAALLQKKSDMGFIKSQYVEERLLIMEDSVAQGVEGKLKVQMQLFAERFRETAVSPITLSLSSHYAYLRQPLLAALKEKGIAHSEIIMESFAASPEPSYVAEPEVAAEVEEPQVAEETEYLTEADIGWGYNWKGNAARKSSPVTKLTQFAQSLQKRSPRLFEEKPVAELAPQPIAIISYVGVQMAAEHCQNWKQGFANLHSPNFGCSVQSNLLAQIDDPRDLIRMRKMTAGDIIRQVNVIQEHGQGGDPSSDAANLVSAGGGVAE